MKYIYFFILSSNLIFCQSSFSEFNSEDFYIKYSNDLKQSKENYSAELFLLTEKKNSTDDFIENLNVLKQDLKGKNIDLNKFVKISEQQISNFGQIIESKQININKKNGHLMLYEGEMKGQKLKFFQYFFIKNEKAYILTYTAKTEDFDLYFNTMKSAMDSFDLNRKSLKHYQKGAN